MAGGTDNNQLKLAAKTRWQWQQQFVDDDEDDDDNDDDEHDEDGNEDDIQDDKDNEDNEHDNDNMMTKITMTTMTTTTTTPATRSRAYKSDCSWSAFCCQQSDGHSWLQSGQIQPYLLQHYLLPGGSFWSNHLEDIWIGSW